MKHYLLLFSLSLFLFLPSFIRAQDTIKTQTYRENSPEISTITLDLEDENKEQNISGLLRSSEDIFVSTAGYTFGSMYYRMRGYDSQNSELMINNLSISDAENGRIVWSNWGGLNDAMRNKEVFNCLTPSSYSFSNIGGLTYINTRASQYRKQLKLTYSYTDAQSYRNRIMLSYSTGPLKHGWSVMLSGSRRWSNEGYIMGTFYDAWSYFLGVEKKFGKNHSLALTVFGAPTKRGQQAASFQEAYDLAGSNYYNPNWGYQNGKVRNAKIKNFHKPFFQLNHFWDINPGTRLTTTVGYMFGKDSWSSLNWYNAPDPRPDYYRYLPSYATDSLTKELITHNWQNDVANRQIDWDHLYQVNYLANRSNRQASYIQENNVTNSHQFSFNTHLDKEINDHINLNSGVNFTFYKANHYKEIMDMLGGNYWVDVDQYAERDFPGDSAISQNDLNHPNRIIHQGDKFGYDYDAHVNSGQFWAQGNFTYNKVDFYASASLSDTWFWRTGNMRNGRHPNNSFGDSKHYNFFNYGIRGGLTYKISGRNFITVNGTYQTEAPYFNNAFISPKVRDDVVPGLTSEKIYGGDISYILRYPWLKARLTYFYTQFMDGTEVTSFYHDDYRTYVNYSLSGVDELHQGIEFGVEVKATKWLSLIGVASVGNYRYTSRPVGTVSFDNGSQPDTASLVYMKNFYVPSSPQTALSGGFKINYKYWFFDLNANYYTNDWLDFYPGRRTEQAIENIGPGDPLIKTITEQQMLKGGFTLDGSIGKSIMIKHKLFINLNLSVTNILDNKNIQSGGYEQNRFDFKTHDISEFPPKYYYYFGRTIFLNLSIRI